MWLKKVPPMPLWHVDDRREAKLMHSSAESYFWKTGVQLKSYPWQCDYWEACAMKSVEKLQLTSTGIEWAIWLVIWKKKGEGEKAWYRFAGCNKILTACGKLQLPDHRVYSESCFYGHHKYCFPGWSSNKVHPKLLFAFMAMLLPFWDDILKNLNSLCGKSGGNKKMSRLKDIRLDRY